MYNIERKSEIITLLEKNGEVDVNSLSERFQISKETVRRDLSELEKDGVLTRTHGGALFNGPDWQKNLTEYPVVIRGIQRYNEKTAICKKAVTLLQDGDTIFIDNSSTSMYLVKNIPTSMHLTIITNSLKILLESLQFSNPNVHYVCLGGSFRDSNLSFHGNITLKNASEFFPDKIFISCTGINAKGIITDASLQEVEAKQIMLERSQKVYLLADYTKFSKTGQVYLAQLLPNNVVVTDSKTSAEDQQMVTALGARIILA